VRLFEMDLYLGYEKHDPAREGSGDGRNGHTLKTVLTENQETVVQVPLNRKGAFEPQIVPKYQKRVPLFNDRIILMYAFGVTDGDIKAQVEKIYNVEVSPELISRVTDGVMEGVKEQRNRALEKSYAVVYLDAIRVKAKREGKSRAKSVYAVLGVNFEGQKKVLGLWTAETEGASDLWFAF
jgi:transposase-like protein